MVSDSEGWKMSLKCDLDPRTYKSRDGTEPEV